MTEETEEAERIVEVGLLRHVEQLMEMRFKAPSIRTLSCLLKCLLPGPMPTDCVRISGAGTYSSSYLETGSLVSCFLTTLTQFASHEPWSPNILAVKFLPSLSRVTLKGGRFES